ncbi:MAG: hypothetical protein A3F91_09465 [Flavobacteria bacterium RIFCSPLOWO2_12_FULL_35_11]|nr:MAG: hypothetical protein A3F91_09465 [Flavobacteria bacterium RIFCSPLOWO2_12_FULL_35_11]
MKKIDTLAKELEALKIKQEMILKKNEEIVSKQNEVEELTTDYRLEGKSTTALENKMYKLIDKEAENLEAQKEISRLIKNLTQRITKREKMVVDNKNCNFYLKDYETNKIRYINLEELKDFFLNGEKSDFRLGISDYSLEFNYDGYFLYLVDRDKPDSEDFDRIYSSSELTSILLAHGAQIKDALQVLSKIKKDLAISDGLNMNDYSLNSVLKKLNSVVEAESKEPVNEAVREKIEEFTEKTDAMLAVKNFLEFVVSGTPHATNSDLSGGVKNMFYMSNITEFSKKEVRDIYLGFPKDDVVKVLYSVAEPEKYNSNDLSNMPNRYNLSCDYESNNLRGFAGQIEDLADLYGEALTELKKIVPDLDLNKPEEIKDMVLRAAERAVSVESVAELAAGAGDVSATDLEKEMNELSEDKSTHKDLV